jgi:hypothetical protein
MFSIVGAVLLLLLILMVVFAWIVTVIPSLATPRLHAIRGSTTR